MYFRVEPFPLLFLYNRIYFILIMTLAEWLLLMNEELFEERPRSHRYLEEVPLEACYCESEMNLIQNWENWENEVHS